MAVSVTGPRAVNELGGPVILGMVLHVGIQYSKLTLEALKYFFINQENLKSS